ncbi:MAG: DMT family transporter [Nitrospirae bacterium]|nr:DMT family transporter [Nitrospirota bacterium]
MRRPAVILPVAALLLGATLWGLIWYPLRLLEGGGISGIWLTLILYVAAAAAFLPWMGSALRELARTPRDFVLLGLFGGWTNIAFVLAMLRGNILRVLLLFYLSPVWAVLMGWVILKERIGRTEWSRLGLVMAGALLMLWDPSLGFPWPRGVGDWLALSAGLSFAASNVVVRGAGHLSIAAKTAGVIVGVVVMAGAMLAILAVPVPAASTTTALGAVALGILGVLGMTMLVQYGVTHMPVHRSAVILLFEIVVGAVSQQMLSDEIVTVRDWIGGGLIILGAYLSAGKNEKEATKY